MDALKYVTKAADIIKKYRFLILMIAVGVILLTIPQDEKKTATAPVQVVDNADIQTVEERLSAILSRMEGAGKATVLLTEAKGEQILYQTDESITNAGNGNDRRTETVLVNNTDKSETGLIRQRIPPVYQGAVILCQGADRAEVRLRIVEAVMSATGLTSDKITVLKMK